jgi:hypothetical protein
MRRFNAQLVLNHDAWTNWDAKLAKVAAFYSDVCDLRFMTARSSYSNLPFEDLAGSAPLRGIQQTWFDENISSKFYAADIVIFVLALGERGSNITPVGMMTGNKPHAYEITIFGTFDVMAHTYQNGKDMGDAMTVILEHELSHVFYAMLGKPDDTHKHFLDEADPGAVLADLQDLSKPEVEQGYLVQFIAFLGAILASLRAKQPDAGKVSIIDHGPIVTRSSAPELLWDNPQNVRHACRVVMDEFGLSWADKDLLCAVIQAESGLDIHAKHINTNGSIDHGLVQVNSEFWIGPGKLFSSVEEIYNNPAKSVRFMVESYKTGHLTRWYAFTNKSFLKFMPK